MFEKGGSTNGNCRTKDRNNACALPKKNETISNLAEEFGVFARTILRDVEVLSVTEPIYTQCGRYGGIYVTDDYSGT